MKPAYAEVLARIRGQIAAPSVWDRAKLAPERAITREFAWHDLDDEREEIMVALENGSPHVSFFDVLDVTLPGVAHDLDKSIDEGEVSYGFSFDEEKDAPILRVLFLFAREQDAEQVRRALTA